MTERVKSPVHGRAHHPDGYDPVPFRWVEIGSGFVDPIDATEDPDYENSWDTATDMQGLRVRDNGLGGIDIEGVVAGGTAPSVVTTLPVWLPLPLTSILIPGTHSTWQLDPDGSLSIIETF